MTRKKRRTKEVNLLADYVPPGIFFIAALTCLFDNPNDISAALVYLTICLLSLGYIFHKLDLPRFRFKFFSTVSTKRPLRTTNFDKMNGHEFEHFLAPLFRKQGYIVEVTRGSGDFGADLVLRNMKGKKTVVQAKRYSSNIGVSAIQEIVAAKPMYKATNAIVVSNRYFTPAAEKLAKANGVKLIDRDELIRMMKFEKQTGLSIVQRVLVLLRLRTQ
ncbi:restriction endonuclease [Alkalihalobacterium sp. APHAB7]|uniref:restriction endonuclease n=1 Tax=Alkalihalobacterium sp. APHAB7 TaxID=3402081 RepID=UPI003AADAFC4